MSVAGHQTRPPMREVLLLGDKIDAHIGLAGGIDHQVGDRAGRASRDHDRLAGPPP